MTIEELKKRKKELGYSNEKIAELSGVPLGTVLKVFGGVTKSPRYKTLRALEAVLFSSAGSTGESGGTDSTVKEENMSGIRNALPPGQRREVNYLAECRTGPIPEPEPMWLYDSASRCRGGRMTEEGIAAEAAPVYRTEEKRKYTIDDYYAFKDEKRRELIDGKIFVMDAPSVKHQIIIGELHILFRECIRSHEKKCRVILSPCDVQIDRDKYTMVQPDILIVCDEEKIRTRVCYGAPDLAVEIMSPSSRSRDSILKLNKYTRAGVREYWIVDPEESIVTVYMADEEDKEKGIYHRYSFHDTIPIGISGGTCTVDFSVVAEAVEGLAD